MRPRAGRNIYLIGFMASGKSTVGRALAERCGRPFIDTDREIERDAERSVPDIFKTEDESGFRRRETRLIMKTTLQSGRIVALGGGAVLKKENVFAIRRSGTVIYLQTPLEDLLRRGARKGDKRPLWQGDIAAVLKSRRPLYQKASHITIRTHDASVNMLASRIIRRLGL